MRKFFFIVTMLVCGASMAQTSLNFTVNVGGEERAYRQYVPEIYDGEDPVPVVFNFHGYGSTALEQEIYADFKPIADTANFIIVYPQGLENTIGSTYWHDFTTMEELAIDLEFFDTMLVILNDNFNIDMTRIYSTGMSNGGFFSYDLACQRSNTIAAIASVSGTMMSNHVDQCNSTVATPVMHFHGTADDIVYYEGNGGLVNALGAEEVVSNWVEHNQCDTVPAITFVEDVNALDGSTVVHYLYSNGDAGASVEFFKIIGGGHSWPGAFPLATLGSTNQDINACQEIWRFFSQYSLDVPVDVTESKRKEIYLEIYPNPAITSVRIKTQEGRFQLMDCCGRILLDEYVDRGEHTIDLSRYDSGIYPCHFYGLEGGHAASKIIIE